MTDDLGSSGLPHAWQDQIQPRTPMVRPGESFDDARIRALDERITTLENRLARAQLAITGLRDREQRLHEVLAEMFRAMGAGQAQQEQEEGRS